MLVDDFGVEDDPGYGIDNYGADMRLDLDCVRNAGVPGLNIFFPALRREDEIGNKRRCVMMPASAVLAEKLGQLPLLRAYPL